METMERIREVLGLSDYEARVYTTLLRHGPSSADKISTLSGVPRTRVYSVLDTLEMKGFVSSVDGRPKTYHPAEPRHVIEMRKSVLEEDLANAGNFLFSIAMNENRPSVTTLNGREQILSLIKEIILSSEKRFYAIVGGVYEKELRSLLPIIRRCAEKADVRILLNSPEETPLTAWSVPLISVYETHIGTSMIVADKEVLYLSESPAGNYSAVCIRDSDLASLLTRAILQSI